MRWKEHPATAPLGPARATAACCRLTTLILSWASASAWSRRVLSRQWQGEFCRCSIDVVGGKQCDGGVDHLKGFRHNAGPSSKAGKPVAQPAVDPLNRHCFILADIVPPNRQELVVRRIIICTVQLDAPGFCYAAPALLRSLSSAAPATGSAWRHHDRHIPSRRGVGQSDQKPARSTACSFFLKEMPELVQFHYDHALARIRLRARRVRCGMNSDPIQDRRG